MRRMRALISNLIEALPLGRHQALPLKIDTDWVSLESADESLQPQTTKNEMRLVHVSCFHSRPGRRTRCESQFFGGDQLTPVNGDAPTSGLSEVCIR